MTPEAIMPLHIDSTMITCARSCMEKFRLEFIYGLRPSGISIDLHAGACFATALEIVRKEVFQNGRTLQDALLRAEAAFQIAWGDYEIPEYKKTSKTRERTWEAVWNDYGDVDNQGYFNSYSPLTDHFQPYYINGVPTFEFTFAIPLEPTSERFMRDGKYYNHNPEDHAGLFPLHPDGVSWLYSGRFDQLGKYEGRPAFGDEKTSGSSISTGWSEKWQLRNQFMGYTWALRQHGIAALGGVVRGISILKTKISHAEAFKAYSNDLVDRWHEQTRRDMWRIRRAWDIGYFDFNFGETCTSFGNCIFLNCCSSNNEMRENWFNDFEVRRWNPLHKNPVGIAA